MSPAERTRWWLKVKARREQELVLVGYEPGKGSHRDLGALLVATHEVEGWRFAGQVGSGMDEATRKLLRQILDEHPLPDPPTPGAPRMPEARWSEPRHVIRVEFTEWTPDGLLRQAVYRAARWVAIHERSRVSLWNPSGPCGGISSEARLRRSPRPETRSARRPPGQSRAPRRGQGRRKRHHRQRRRRCGGRRWPSSSCATVARSGRPRRR